MPHFVIIASTDSNNTVNFYKLASCSHWCDYACEDAQGDGNCLILTTPSSKIINKLKWNDHCSNDHYKEIDMYLIILLHYRTVWVYKGKIIQNCDYTIWQYWIKCPCMNSIMSMYAHVLLCPCMNSRLCEVLQYKAV